MTDQLDPAMARLKRLLQHAVDSLDPADREDRARWCEEHNAPGVRASFDDPEVITFTWGGRKLAEIDRSLLVDPDATYEAVLMPEFDTMPDDWTGPHPGSSPQDC